MYEQSLPSLNPKGFKILLDFLVHLPRGTTVFTGAAAAIRCAQVRCKQIVASRPARVLQYLYDVTLGKYITPFAFFCAFLLMLGSLFVSQILPLMPLYADRSLQTSVRRTLTEVSNREGWLVSDIEVKK